MTRKGARRAKVPLPPATAAALDAYLLDRTHRSSNVNTDLSGRPLLATAAGARLDQSALYKLVRRLARAAAVPSWDRLSPHSTPARRWATCRTSPGTATRAPPAATTDPATAWTATPPTPLPPTSPQLPERDLRRGLRPNTCGDHGGCGSLPSRGDPPAPVSLDASGL